MIRPFAPKDPDSFLPYWFDATDFADDEGSPVASMDLAVDEGDGLLTLEDQARVAGIIVFWPLGGTVGETYTVRCRCTLENGTVEDCSRTMKIVEK